MKLTIRSDVAASLNKLLSSEYTDKYHFQFGKMERAGFVPFLSQWDYQCIKESLEGKYPVTKQRVGHRGHQKICDIGFVTDRRVIMSKITVDEGDELAVSVFNVESFSVLLIRSQYEYQVEIALTWKPKSLKEFFEPIKFLYGLLESPVSLVDDATSVITEYNALFSREQDTPWIVPQGLRFLSESDLGLLTDYVVMPTRRGEKYMLYLSKRGAYLVSKREVLKVVKTVPSSLYNTVVMGDWFENTFTVYDIALMGGQDLRKKSLLQRIKALRVVSIRFSFCEIVRCYRTDIARHTEELLAEYGGVIFAPISANYMNDRVFLYQTVENVGIKFKLKQHSECGFGTYTLKTGVHGDLFMGTKEFPYDAHIPLCLEDREFIGPLNNTVFEFRWESDGLIPYTRAYENESSTSKFARQAWTYMNDPLDKEVVIENLRIFKKETTYAKEKLAMAKQLGKLKMIPVNKTVVFWSPIEGEDVLVRTGTIAEGSCFVAGTRVYTTQGVKNIEDVKIGDEVITHTGCSQTVLQTHKNPLGDRNIHKLNVYKTPNIMVTNNHPFYAVKRTGSNKYSSPEWINVSELDGSHYVMIPNKSTDSSKKSLNIEEYIDELSSPHDYIITEETIQRKSTGTSGNYSCAQSCNKNWTIDKDFCYFMGLWFGDGCIHSVKRKDKSHMKGISFVASTSNYKVTDFIKTYGERLFGINSCVYINDKQKLITVVFNNVIIAETFNYLFGKGFGGKHLPNFIHELDTEMIKHFVAGLITTDGCVDTKLNISLCMTNPEFIEELYHLCRSHGIDCSVAYRPSQSGKQTGYMRFTRGSVLVERLQKAYNDDRMERLRMVETREGNSGSTLRLNGDTFLKVVSNEVTDSKPDHVYTLGVEEDHSYAVEGLVVQNCFFHSLLYAYSKEYVTMDKRGRMKFVRRLRASMAGKIDHESWEEMGGGLIAKIPFQENVNDILVNFYRFITNDSRARGSNTRKVIKNLVGDDAQELELYKLITELIKIEDFEKVILPAAYNKTEEDKIATCCDAIIEETLDFLNKKEEIKSLLDKKAEYIRNIVRKLLKEVLTEAQDSAFKDYVKGLENVAEDVDSYTIGIISDRFKRDIYFLDGKNRMPYNNSSTTENLKGRKSVIVLWIGGNHYEIVGRLLPGNRIQREFSHDDDLVQKLYTFLVKPEDIPEKYPGLVSYLPREFRKSDTPSPHRFTDSEDSDSDKSGSARHRSSSSDPDDNDEDDYYRHSSDEGEET